MLIRKALDEIKAGDGSRGLKWLLHRRCHLSALLTSQKGCLIHWISPSDLDINSQ